MKQLPDSERNNHIPFGRTGLKVPPLIFGATSLGNLFRVVAEDEKAKIVQTWAESGFSPFVIDSAGKYGAGLSLEVIGRELENLEVEPSQVLISNKLGWRRVALTGSEPTFEPGAWFGLKHDAVQDISRDGILRCWEEGEELLGSYSAQLVSVHDPDEYLAQATDAVDQRRRHSDIVDAYAALRELHASGQVSAVGVGAKNWKTIELLARDCEFDWVMFANSFTIMRHPQPLVEFMTKLADQKVAIINSALFHGGFLLGGEFFDYRRVDTEDAGDRERLAWRERFTKICESFDASPFDVGVAFGRALPGITSVALSSSRADRIESHRQAVEWQPPDGIWQAMRDARLIQEHVTFV